MLRKFLSCDICGSKWDITNTEYHLMSEPGAAYRNDCVLKGWRKFNIERMTVKSDNRVYFEGLDLCDKCYNKLDRFIFDLMEEGEADANL